MLSALCFCALLFIVHFSTSVKGLDLAYFERKEKNHQCLYFVDGRYRVACVCICFLHALEHGNARAKVLLHDYNKSKRKEYHQVETIANIVNQSHKGILVILRLKESVSRGDVFKLWKKNRLSEL